MNSYSSYVFIHWFDKHTEKSYPEVQKLISEDVYHKCIKEDETVSVYHIITRLDDKKYTVYAIKIDGKLKPFRVITKNMCPYPIHIDNEPIEGQMTLSVIYD